MDLFDFKEVKYLERDTNTPTFLGESQTCAVVTPGGTAMTVKALSATGLQLQAGDPVLVRWATADA